MDEDQELNMIMTYNSGAKSPEIVGPGGSPTKLDESNGNSSFQNFYQQQHNQQSQERLYAQGRAQNEDLINLENSLQVQQEAERRSKRQQQQLQEQQFRLSMSSMKNQINEVIQEVDHESQRSYTGRESAKEIHESMIQQDIHFNDEQEGVGENEKYKEDSN